MLRNGWDMMKTHRPAWRLVGHPEDICLRFPTVGLLPQWSIFGTGIFHCKPSDQGLPGYCRVGNSDIYDISMLIGDILKNWCWWSRHLWCFRALVSWNQHVNVSLVVQPSAVGEKIPRRVSGAWIPMVRSPHLNSPKNHGTPHIFTRDVVLTRWFRRVNQKPRETQKGFEGVFHIPVISQWWFLAQAWSNVLPHPVMFVGLLPHEYYRYIIIIYIYIYPTLLDL